MKVLFLDTETTGTDPKLHGIIQIAGVVFIDGEEREKFDIKMKPAPGRQIDAEALQVSGTTLADLGTRHEARQGWSKLVTILDHYVSRYEKTDKFIMAGYNVRFDEDMLRELWKCMDDPYFGSWFWTPSVDIMALAAARMAKARPAFPNFKLETVAQHLGVQPKGDIHDALVDIEMTIDVARIVAPELFEKE